MKTILTTAILIGIFSIQSHGQLVINDLNVNNYKEIQYIQLTFTIDKKEFKPIYYIDFGMLEQHAPVDKTQIIKINDLVIKNTMSPMLVLNKLYEAGWEYLGDMEYVDIPMMDRWYIYTLRRRI